MRSSYERELSRGEKALSQGRLDRAEAIYRAILYKNPKQAEVNYRLGEIANRKNNSNSALQFFKIAIESDPREKYLASYVSALIKNGNFDQAHTILSKSLKDGVTSPKLKELDRVLRTFVVNKQTAEGLTKELISNFKDMKYDEVEKISGKLLKIFPHHGLSLKILGAVYENSNRLTDALRIHERLVTAHPLDPEANNNLGSTLKKLKKFDDAKKFYDKAIALKPDYYQAIYNLGMIYSAESDYSSALFYFRMLEGLNHDIRDIDLIISMLESRIKRGQGTVSSEKDNRISNKTQTKREVIILNREVEQELIEYLYESKSSNLKEAPGPRFGKGRCSIGYNLFDNSSKIIKLVSGNLVKIIEDEQNSKIYITDSFF